MGANHGGVIMPNESESLPLIILGVEWIILLVIFIILPYLSPRNYLFYIPVGPEGNRTPEARRIIRIWQIAVFAISLIALAMGFGVSHLTQKKGLAWIVAITGGVLGWVPAFIFCRKLSRSLRVHVRDVRVTSLIPKSVFSYIPLWTEAPAWLIVAGIWITAIWTFPLLGEKFPLHFNINGEVDRWGDKTLTNAFLLPGTTAWIYGIMHWVVWGIAHARHHVTSVEELDHLRRRRIWTMQGVKYYILLLLTAVFLDTQCAALGYPPLAAKGIGTMALLGTPALIIMLLVGFGITGKKRSSEPVGAGMVGEDNEQFWHWWGYFNPEDPVFFIEKRFGVGYTFNFGHLWGVAAFFGLIFLPLVLIPFLAG